MAGARTIGSCSISGPGICLLETHLQLPALCFERQPSVQLALLSQYSHHVTFFSNVFPCNVLPLQLSGKSLSFILLDDFLVLAAMLKGGCSEMTGHPSLISNPNEQM